MDPVDLSDPDTEQDDGEVRFAPEDRVWSRCQQRQRGLRLPQTVI